jgi:hypothetical protein
MIFNENGKSFLVRIERRSLGHGPALQDSIQLEPKIVMKAGRVVFLHDESERTRRALSRAPRLGSRIKSALGPISLESHLGFPRINLRTCC